MKIMVFVVDDLLNKNLSEVYVKWNKMYLISRLERFKKSDLKIFQVFISKFLNNNYFCNEANFFLIIKQTAINDWANLFIKLFREFSPSDLKIPKLHSWIYHIVNTIEDFGAINGYTTETYESLHKTYVKIPYRLSNRKNAENQLMQNVIKNLIFLKFFAIVICYINNFSNRFVEGQ